MGTERRELCSVLFLAAIASLALCPAADSPLPPLVGSALKHWVKHISLPSATGRTDEGGFRAARWLLLIFAVKAVAAFSLQSEGFGDFQEGASGVRKIGVFAID